MRQRIRFAQAIAHDPEIIILDEPLSGLDPLGKRKLIHLIKDYRDQGRTILVSSHVLPEIEAMTSRIILIHQGKILAQGDIHYIRDLIETHPHIISVQCDDPRALAARFVSEPYVQKLHFEADGDGPGRRDAQPGRASSAGSTPSSWRGASASRRSPRPTTTFRRCSITWWGSDMLRTVREVAAFFFFLGRRARKVRAFVLLGLLPVALAVVVRIVFAGRSADVMSVFQDILMIYDLQFLAVILTLFYGTSVCSEEIEGKTLPYLTTRPLSKSGIIIGKYAAYTALSALIVVLSLAASYLIMNGPRLGTLGGLDGPPALRRGPPAGPDGLHGPVHVPGDAIEEIHPHRAGLRVRLGDGHPVFPRIDPALLDRPLPEVAVARIIRRGSTPS